MDGFLLIDKPAGITSHDAVDAVRHITGERRVGHAGTLDPFATGLLIVGVGRRATKEMARLVGLDKTYEAVFALGASSDTDDRTGVIKIPSTKFQIPSEADIRTAMASFAGEIEQVPPRYSAVKIRGQKMYEAARKGKTLEAKPRRVRISAFDLLEPPTIHDSRCTLHVKISCSSGTYIRALARDLGAKLGTGGYVEELRRTRIGPFGVSSAVTLEALGSPGWENRILPIQSVLDTVKT